MENVVLCVEGLMRTQFCKYTHYVVIVLIMGKGPSQIGLWSFLKVKLNSLAFLLVLLSFLFLINVPQARSQSPSHGEDEYVDIAEQSTILYPSPEDNTYMNPVSNITCY